MSYGVPTYDINKPSDPLERMPFGENQYRFWSDGGPEKEIKVCGYFCVSWGEEEATMKDETERV